MNKKVIRDLEIKGKKVLVRVDYNVPLEDGKITSNNRIVKSLPTLNYILENGGKAILMSHLGRPKGEVNEKFSLKVVAEELEKLTNRKVNLVNIDDNAASYIENMKSEEIALLENVRFFKAETENDESFSKLLASLADLFILDAFGTSHRAHSSTSGVADYLPSAVGYLVEDEIKNISKAIECDDHPKVVIMGGSKVKDKIKIIDKLIDNVDAIMIGGGMSYTILKAKGENIGASILDEEEIEYCKNMLKKAEEKGVKIYLPIDHTIVKNLKAENQEVKKNVKEIIDGYAGVDIGEQTIKLYGEVIKNAKVIIWNGPVGIFEMEEFSNGTKCIANLIAENKEAYSVIGGGDSESAINQLGLTDKFSHISTGGGASLKMLEGKELVALKNISEK